ncbi:hypothetical protein C8A00DRAFT_33933 [Chaetomidium leptoderma]|uniref:SPRY domain-containing protein n=1 Tax=Chaetomidium leptoderma TaxID=669021 RepID=A0AAN6ZWW6_9PEZI|nr:hypothetical protein C8A00DRAFT_33933 [Chaetomidium leptoderma]
MCFGSKNDAGDTGHADAPRPAQGQQPYASEQKRASVPHQYHQQPPSNDFAPPAGPPPGKRPPAVDDFAPPPGPPPSQRPAGDDFAPPPGPPPSHRPAGNDFAPPQGPPPSHRPAAGDDDFAPPPGPPPTHHPKNDLSYMAPPPGPPPAHNDLGYMAPPPGPPPADTKPNPQHDWEAVVPDTSLFPPPPSFFSGFDRSPANNATEAEAEAGEAWCIQHPLVAPITPDGPAITALNAHNPRLMQPDAYRGNLMYTAPGVWKGSTNSQAADSTIIAYPPLYTVTLHSPLAHPSRPKTTIYYEVQLTHAHNPRHEICLAMGYTALPYPSFRMPGWHRGSLAVHGDDGHRFVNDRWGGKAFAAPFVRGERYGIGMTFCAVGGRIETDVFFTRQGREVGRWGLHEETDAEQDLPVTGLEGYHDLTCAVGTSGETGFEVVFDPARWLFKPVGY